MALSPTQLRRLAASRRLDHVVVLGANGTMGYGGAALFTQAIPRVTFLARSRDKAREVAPEAVTMELVLKQLPQHIICAVLGLVVGALGVALAIGLAISIQLLLPPAYALSIGVMPLMVIAAIAGLLVSWLLGRLAYRSLPRLLDRSDERGLQVILVFSVFTSLLQTLLFFARM